MSDNDYEYQCMRAELLGLPKPEKPDPSLSLPKPDDNGNSSDVPVDELDLDVDAERFQRTSGGLDEINNILQTTQKKINKFKTVFGSVTSLLKGRSSAEGSTENLRGSSCSVNDGCSSSTADDEKPKDSVESHTSGEETVSADSGITTKITGVNPSSAKKIDVEAMLSSHIQTLDSMVYKADDINMKMNYQNKQMKNYINK